MKKEDIISYIEDAFLLKSHTLLPPKEVIRFETSSFFTTMPIVISNWKIAGLKVVRRSNIYLPTVKSEIFIYDLDTGSLIRQVNGEEITTYRTSFLAYYSYLHYSKENIEVLSFIGLGNISKNILKLIFENKVKKPSIVKLKKYKNQHIDFSKLIRKYDREVTIVYCETYIETLNNSDVIISAVTYFEEDICTIEDLKKGSLLLPIHTRGFLNCDSEFDRVITDDLNHIKDFQNYRDFKNVIEIEEIIQGKKIARSTDDERIVVYAPGIVLLDIYFALKMDEKET